MTPRLPRTIGRYEVLDFVGEGGMGVVYRARDPRIARVVAIKLLRIDSTELRSRFEREARSAGNLTHANIVTIFDFGEHDGQPFIVMEFVEGRTLAEQIRDRVPLALTTKLDLMEMLAGGLAFAHRQGVIHRDVKPANLMIDRQGVLKILDFGIARVEESGVTKAGMMVGTPNYMSPEQVDGRELDARSDIFSVGAVFYEVLTSQQAFTGNSIHGVLDAVLHREPEPLSVLRPQLDPAIQQIVGRALAKNPDDRYQSLGQLRLDLSRCRANLAETGVESDARPTALASSTPTPAGRTPRSGTSREAIARRRAEQIDAHLKTASEAYQAGDYEGAIASCEHVVILDPDHPDALTLMDRAREALDRKRAAEEAEAAEAERERAARLAEEEARRERVRRAAEAAQQQLARLVEGAARLEQSRLADEAKRRELERRAEQARREQARRAAAEEGATTVSGSVSSSPVAAEAPARDRTRVVIAFGIVVAMIAIVLMVWRPWRTPPQIATADARAPEISTPVTPRQEAVETPMPAPPTPPAHPIAAIRRQRQPDLAAGNHPKALDTEFSTVEAAPPSATPTTEPASAVTPQNPIDSAASSGTETGVSPAIGSGPSSATGTETATPPPPLPQPADEDLERARRIAFEHQAIDQVLNKYVAAYNSLDARAVLVVAPKERSAVERFKDYQALRMVLSGCTMDVLGEIATVTCTRQFEVVTKRGRQTLKPAPVAVTISLRRSTTSWSIDAVR